MTLPELSDFGCLPGRAGGGSPADAGLLGQGADSRVNSVNQAHDDESVDSFTGPE